MRRGSLRMLGFGVMAALAAPVATASAVTGSLPGGTAVSVAITSPAANAIVASGSLTVSGTASVGAGTAVKDTTVVYVLDVSGSTSADSGVDCVGGPATDTILACEKAAIAAVNADAQAASSPVLNSGVAAFSSSGTELDVDPAPGTQLLAAPGAGIDAAVGALGSGGGTSFIGGLTAANTILADAAVAATKHVVFLSDGSNGDSSGSLPTLPAGTIVHAFAIAGAGCGSGPLSLTAVADLGDTGSSCTQVSSIANLDDLIADATGATLDSLSISVDGGPTVAIGNAGITPDLPQSGPASVTYTVSVAVAAGTFPICVTANGADGGGPGSVSDCVTVTVPEVTVVCTPSTPCQGTIDDADGNVAQFTGTGLNKTVGLDVGSTAPAGCAGVECVAAFDVLFTGTTGNGVAELTMTATRENSIPPGLANVYIDGVRVTRTCTATSPKTGKNAPALPCRHIKRVSGGRTQYYVRFGADPRVSYH